MFNEPMLVKEIDDVQEQLLNGELASEVRIKKPKTAATSQAKRQVYASVQQKRGELSSQETKYSAANTQRSNVAASQSSRFTTTNLTVSQSIFGTSKVDLLPHNFVSQAENVLAERKLRFEQNRAFQKVCDQEHRSINAFSYAVNF
jgi:hypothetical protein